MSEIIDPPSDWTPYLDLSESDLQSAIGRRRPVSIKSYKLNGKRVYCGVLVNDDIEGLSWSANIAPDALETIVADSHGRLVSLDAFWDNEARELRCAAAWVSNAQDVVWGAQVDLDEIRLSRMLETNFGKLTCLRAYLRPADPNQDPPIAFVTRYAAIWVRADGEPWNYAVNIDGPSLGLKLDDEAARLVSIDCHPLGAGSDGKLAAVWWRNAGNTWFWNIGYGAQDLRKQFPRFCSYGLDIVSAGNAAFASIMCQYPRPADANAASLVDLSSEGEAFFRDDLGQDLQFHFDEQNLVARPVRYSSAVKFSAAEGGWSWWSGNFVAAGTNIDGVVPLNVPAGGPVHYDTGRGTVSNNPKIGVFCLTATDDAGKHQNTFVQSVLTQPGFSSPPPLAINWPVYVGLVGPVEALELANGMVWIPVLGTICNGTNLKMTVTNVSVRLRKGPWVFHQNYIKDLLADIDETGQQLKNASGQPQAVIGPVEDSSWPVLKFVDAFDATHDFLSGTLKVQINVKFAGTLECYGDVREVDVTKAPITVMPHLPYGPVPEDGQHWKWGNGPDANYVHAHSTPEHRYSYDLDIVDASGATMKAGSDRMKNESFYCFDQPILAMDDGIVLIVDDTHADNLGQSGAPPNPQNNVIVILNAQTGIYQLYVHMKQGSATVAVGAMVQAGDQIAQVGNAQVSSEPHLHLGIARRDAEGFLRPLPMTFQRIKDANGRTVSGVPVDQGRYSA